MSGWCRNILTKQNIIFIYFFTRLIFEKHFSLCKGPLLWTTNGNMQKKKKVKRQICHRDFGNLVREIKFVVVATSQKCCIIPTCKLRVHFYEFDSRFLKDFPFCLLFFIIVGPPQHREVFNSLVALGFSVQWQMQGIMLKLKRSLSFCSWVACSTKKSCGFQEGGRFLIRLLLLAAVKWRSRTQHVQ